MIWKLNLQDQTKTVLHACTVVLIPDEDARFSVGA